MRELAAQTVRECKKLAKGRKYYIKLMTKDLSKSGNFKDMHCDILVSTPLRLDHAIKKKDLDLSRSVIKILYYQLSYPYAVSDSCLFLLFEDKLLVVAFSIVRHNLNNNFLLQCGIPCIG
jgi:hypothetical protein